MDQLKVIRTVCLFTERLSEHALAQLDHLARVLANCGFVIQTQRVCSPDIDGVFALDRQTDKPVLFSIGRQTYDGAQELLSEFLSAKNVSFNVDLTNEQIHIDHLNLLTKIMR